MEETKLIQHCANELRKKGYAVDVGVEIVPGKSQYGKTDVLAFKGNTICAIECKFINSTNATKKRKKVKDQAITYSSILKWKYPKKVVKAFTYTNEGLRFLGEVTEDKGRARALEYFARVGLRLKGRF